VSGASISDQAQLDLVEDRQLSFAGTRRAQHVTPGHRQTGHTGSCHDHIEEPIELTGRCMAFMPSLPLILSRAVIQHRRRAGIGVDDDALAGEFERYLRRRGR
jgi:hypothetical protein